MKQWKIGISAFAWTGQLDSSHLRLLSEIKEMGFDAFEIPMFDPADLDVGAIRQAYAASGLDCTICAILPVGINPISPDPDVRRRSEQHLARCIETAGALDAKLLGGPLYAPIGYLPEHRPTDEEWDWAVDYFRSAATLLAANRVTLSIEPVNRSETFFLRTARETKKLCEAIGHKHIGVTIDTFHANIEERNIADAVRVLGPWLTHLHLSENDRSLLGQGHIPFSEILTALQDIQYGGYLMIEGFGYSSLEKTGPGVLWAEFNVSPKDIALNGIQYLRSLQVN
jgi:D-psicose/D-tagatose/L-ribulose 3-epimerase